METQRAIRGAKSSDASGAKSLLARTESLGLFGGMHVLRSR